MSRITLHSYTVHETPLLRTLHQLGASGVRLQQRPATHESVIEAVLPARLAPEVRTLCERLNRVGGSGHVELAGVGFRGHGAVMTQELVRQLGPPLDWPLGKGELPRLGEPFPALPAAAEARRA